MRGEPRIGRAGRNVFLFALLFYLLAVAASAAVFALKRDALRFHPRDYNYFIEQAARLADPKLSNRFALNINGYNFLGMSGIEGVKGVYGAIHAEWFRYTYTAVYGLFHGTLAVYIYYALVFFAPMLYFAFLQRRQPGGGWPRVALYSALFVLYPALINTVTFDLRARILFLSAWSLVILAVYHRRPFLEKLLFFALLIGIREEGILLGLIVIAFNFLRMGDKPGKWKQTLIFLALSGAAFAAFLAFMAWGGYNHYGDSVNPFAFLVHLLTIYPAPILALALLLAGLVGWVWLARREHFAELLLFLVYSVAILLAGFQFLRSFLSEDTILALFAQGPSLAGYLRVATWGETSLLYYVLLLLLFLLWDHAQKFACRLLQGVLILLAVVFAATTVYYVPSQLAAWREKAVSARLVWDFKAGHDKYLTNVLVDDLTYQAFYDVENTLVYNRLPIWIVDSENRYFPANKPFLINLLQQRMQYAVIGQESLENVRGVAREAGVPVTVLASNDRYVVLKFK